MLSLFDEAQRLDILSRYSILDTPPEELFDRIARMAAQHLHTPIGTVNFIDKARQWFKATHGLELREIDRNHAFCHYTIMSDSVMVINDTSTDLRFLDNPFVANAPNLRFYAGAPLVTAEGWRLGTVSVIDYVPHPNVSSEDCRFLEDLAAMAVHELEMRLAASNVREEIDTRRKIERDLRAANERFNLAVAHSPMVLATQDRDLRYIWAANLPYPLRLEDLRGKRDDEVWPPEIARRIGILKQRVLGLGETVRTDMRLMLAGREQFFDFTFEPLREDGYIVGLSTAAIDVTARKQSEMALIRAEARYRAIFETAVDAMVVIDEAGTIHQFNPAAERIFGYSASEAIGANVSNLMPEPDRSSHDGYIEHYLRTGQAKIIGIGRQVMGKRKDGSLFPLDLSVAEWRDDRKRFFTGIMRDITKRKEAEAALLREAEERRKAEAERAKSLALLNAMIESIPEAIFSKDRHGRYLIVNSAASRILVGTTDAEIVGKSDYDLLPAAVADSLRRIDLAVMAQGRVSIVEEDLPDAASGEMRSVLTAKSPLRSARGDIVGIVGIALDTTERKAMMRELQAAKDEAERANLAKSKFLAAASHDLRQPVQAMALFSSMIADQLHGHPAAKAMENMEAALEALKMLLDALLDVSRLDAGIVQPEPQTFPIAGLIERLGAEYVLHARSKGLEFQVMPSSAWTTSDPVLLERILRNLLENAVRYTERGKILLGCRRQGRTLRIQVHDTGLGIAPDQQEAIFHEFFQVENPERDRTKGLGLGLSIVQRLTALLGHDLRVFSMLGHGSCFSVTLPLVPPPKA